MKAGTLNPIFDATLLSRIEDAGLNASAPPQQRWLDGWLVRFSPAKAKRARCVNAVAVGRTPIAVRLQRCEALFAAVELPLIFRITPFTQPAELEPELVELGLERFDDTRVMVLSVLPATPAALPAGLSLHPLGLEAFAQRVGGFRNSPLAHRQAHAERLLHSPVPFFAFELRRDGVALACGQFAIEDDLAGLYDVFTAESARGQGLAGVLCSALLSQARSRGARHAYLQVDRDNEAARRVYFRLGFDDGYAYHYRARHPSAA